MTQVRRKPKAVRSQLPVVQAWVLWPDGTETEVSPANGKDFQLQEIKDLLKFDRATNGREWIEIVYLGTLVMIVDSDGWLRPQEQQEPNLRATRVARQRIEGPALLCPRRWIR